MTEQVITCSVCDKPTDSSRMIKLVWTNEQFTYAKHLHYGCVTKKLALTIIEDTIEDINISTESNSALQLVNSINGALMELLD